MNLNKKIQIQLKTLESNILTLRKKSEKLKESLIQNNFSVDEVNTIDNDLDKHNFCHLHNHTQFSMLQSTIKIRDLVDITYKNSMNAVAVTDLGNMMEHSDL